MKIKVTIERDCCHSSEDLQPYRGKHMLPRAWQPKFCKHCGQLWILKRFTIAAGSIDSEYVRFVPQIPADK